MTYKDHNTSRRVAFYTLGCKLNFAETSAIGSLLADRGYVRANPGEEPALVVVNTCSVTEVADKKGRQLVRRIAARHPEARIVVTGCYAQLKPDEVAALDGVDLVLGSQEKLKIIEFLDALEAEQAEKVNVTPFREISTFSHSCERGDRTRYFLKVQDGCDYFCTYCTIPYARGRSRSPKPEELVALATDAAAKGAKEIILTGVNIGDFGNGSQYTFFDLIRMLDEVEGISRYRISSIEPNLLTPQIIEWVARDARAFMPHFHIPLQAGSDKVLKMMNRRYDTALFADRIAMVRELIPQAFIGVDVIAGARGETPEEWDKSVAFIDSLPVSRLHVFPYSERPGTAALLLPDPVSQREKHRRVAVLTQISDAKLDAFMRASLGSTRPVLWEHPHKNTGLMHGFTDNYIRVERSFDPALVNTVTDAALREISPFEADTIIAEE